MAPGAWSEKDERMYEHIKQSERQRGRSGTRAKEVAARTVNKQRRQEGRTAQRSSQGTGNPNTALEDRTVQELRNRAAQLGIKGRSALAKADLVNAIRRQS